MESTMKTVKIGLIGCGRVAPQHVEGYQQADGVQIAALCAPRLEKAHALADRYALHDAKFFADYRDMLAQRDIVDAVDIMTPDYLHASVVKDCIAAGLPMLCEKPMALDSAEAAEMHSAAERAGLLAMVGLNYRFNPAVATAKKLVDEGFIGKPYHLRARLTVSRLSNPDIPLDWRHNRARGGLGALSDLGAHLVDLARFMLDDEFAVVTGLGQIFIRTRLNADTGEQSEVTAYDAATFSGKMRSGILINIEVSRFAAGGNSFEVDGSLGSIRFMDGKLYKWAKQITDHQTPSSGFEPAHVDPEQFEVCETNIYARFIHCLQTNTTAHPDFYDGVVCQKVLDAVDESIRTGRSVSFE